MTVCVAVAGQTVAAALEVAKGLGPEADVIEIRLDYIKDIHVSPFISAISRPLLFTNRPVWEGGHSQETEQIRLAPLIRAVELNAAYIDLEVRAPEDSRSRILAECQKSPTQLILSWHDFDKTPKRAELVDMLKRMRDGGADIGKIVTMAHEPLDVLRVLRLQEDAAKMNFPLIAFCMGPCGVISRLATLELGGYMTYCSANQAEATAPGQLSASTLRDLVARLHPQE